VTQKVYITDCEGPVSRNDNAYEIAEAFLPEGGRLFSLLSKFDDYLGDIEKIKGHAYGSTLKYILPFLKAAGVTDKDVREFSSKHMSVMKGIRETLASIREIMEIYVVSTSYIHYIEEIAKYLGLESANMFSTKVSFDDYEMGEREKKMIMSLQNAFLQLPAISWDEANTISPEALFSIDSLKAFFLERLPALPVNRWIKGVNPIGGAGKADAIINIAKRNNLSLEDVIYVGDSITDVDALSLVGENGGLSISFNGNRYAVLHAEYSVVSKETDILRDIAITFSQTGKRGIKEGTEREGTFVCSRENCNIDNVISFSERMRKEVRGEAIGSLG
jgi:predicted HAD superfamily phosphohydrolase